ncbi:MAG TPA: c-type cytochrome [Blastocatellia bacterium]|nr:c-type cytochrome [Blastocatellia bacterium]HMV85493.1 c-type cytochrome [Blastocatellia bacterium]HMX26283.1 c-type cytochrome [Blastocatellia bacterium]HMY71564.1 c-type cytochrome [Blastocatellia bacterium]HMZ18692.1 c-type cytochrome [Blastocatellia bacterium]
MENKPTRKLQLTATILLVAVYGLLPATSAQDQSANIAANIEAGRRVFTGSCSMGYCHGLGGVGGGAPKLAGRKFSVRYLNQVISEGVPETTMPSFKTNLSKEQIGNLIIYIQSLAPSATTESNQPATQAAAQEHLPTSGNKPATMPTENAAAPKPIAVSAEDRELMGDVAAGQKLFFDPAQTDSCRVCHAVNGRGGKVAPDLADVAAKPAKDILQSITEPNARVDEKFATLKLTLKDGGSVTGVKRDEDATSLRLYDTSSLPPISRTFLKTDIAKTEKLKTSAMPADYGAKYSRQQLLDLVGFLKTAGGGESR